MAQKPTPQKKALTPEQLNKKLDKVYADAQAKAVILSGNTQRKVIPIVIHDFVNVGEFVVGFMYRPDLITQLRLSDRGQEFITGFSQEEGSKVLEALLIKAESDPRINMETEEGELFWKGAITVLYEFVTAARAVIKKN